MTLQQVANSMLAGYPFDSGGGGGAVDSVNGQTGVVVLDAADVGALDQTAADARYPLKTAPDPYPAYLTQTEANGLYATPASVSTAITTHEGLADPHAIYLTQTEGDARYQTPAQSAALYLPLTGGTLTGNLVFSTDNTRDIGASGATRPRDLFLARNLTVGGTVSVPNGAIAGAAIADSGITSAKIADGTIATADLADGAVTNAKLAADTARANLLTNGGFEIWQRGNGPFNTHAAYGPDRWLVFLGGTSMSISRDTTNVDGGSLACVAVTTTGGGNLLAQDVMKSGEYGNLRGRTLAFSVRVRTTTANTCRALISDGVTNTYSAFHSGGGAYETLGVTVAIPPAATAIAVYVEFASSCTAYIDNAMLVVGAVPAEYAPMHPADDLARCLRYYEKVGPSSNYPQISTYAAAGSGFYTPFVWAAKKAATPTVTVNGTFAYVNASTANTTGPGTVDGVMFGATATALGSCIVYSNNSGYLTAEANP